MSFKMQMQFHCGMLKGTFHFFSESKIIEILIHYVSGYGPQTHSIGVAWNLLI